MHILLITGRLAEADVRSAAQGTQHEVEVDVLPIDIAAFITPRGLSRWLKQRAGAGKEGVEASIGEKAEASIGEKAETGIGEKAETNPIELILVSGLIKSDFSALEAELGVPIRLGPRHAYDLRTVLPMLDEVELSATVPACTLLSDVLKKRAFEQLEQLEQDAQCSFSIGGVKLGGEARMKVLAEVVDADRLSQQALEDKLAYFLESGADMLDLGISLDAEEADVKRAVELAKGFGLPVSVDTLEPELIRAGMEAGCDMVLSLRADTIRALGSLDAGVAYVVLPEEGALSRAQSVASNIELAKRAGAEHLVADPVLAPAGAGCAASLCELLAFRKLCPSLPLFLGVGNITELLDADSVGMNALLTAIGAELGASILFTPEYSDKTKGSVRELATASKMAQLAGVRHTSPKDLGIDLLVLKEKRKRAFVSTPEGCTEGVSRVEWDLDPRGAFSISLTCDGKILASHRKACIVGSTAREVYDTIVSSGLVSSLSHAFYLGGELARAELALKLGRSYAQDDEW